MCPIKTYKKIIERHQKSQNCLNIAREKLNCKVCISVYNRIGKESHLQKTDFSINSLKHDFWVNFWLINLRKTSEI